MIGSPTFYYSNIHNTQTKINYLLRTLNKTSPCCITWAVKNSIRDITAEFIYLYFHIRELLIQLNKLYKDYKLDVIFGMYHDQILTPYKTLFKYDAINITLGLPYIRISPDHGVAENIIGKNIANPKSLIESIKFFNLIK